MPSLVEGSSGACLCLRFAGSACRAMLEGETQPGVWFPEEPGALQKRTLFFERATRGCQRWALNKPTWALESDPRQLGFGIYY